MTDKQCPFEIGDELAVCSNGFSGRIVHCTVKVTRILKAYFETDNGAKWDFGRGGIGGGEIHCHVRGKHYSSTYATPYTAAIKKEQAEKRALTRARDHAERILNALRRDELTAEQVRSVNAFIGDLLPEQKS